MTGTYGRGGHPLPAGRPPRTEPLRYQDLPYSERDRQIGPRQLKVVPREHYVQTWNLKCRATYYACAELEVDDTLAVPKRARCGYYGDELVVRPRSRMIVRCPECLECDGA